MVTLPAVARPLADNPQHRREVEEIIMARADYFQLVAGGPPRSDEVEDFFNELPPGCAPADKSLFGFYAGGQIAGISVTVRRWNTPYKAHIGLLQLTPSWRQKGNGRRAYAHIEALAKTWPGITCLRLAVIDGNHAGMNFWRRMGFVETGERRGREPPIWATR
jgi:GNAT superfamily N-acetyltransferase